MTCFVAGSPLNINNVMEGIICLECRKRLFDEYIIDSIKRVAYRQKCSLGLLNCYGTAICYRIYDVGCL